MQCPLPANLLNIWIKQSTDVDVISNVDVTCKGKKKNKDIFRIRGIIPGSHHSLL